ncbi:unnamed protein product, partial [Mycena citricolor]
SQARHHPQSRLPDTTIFRAESLVCALCLPLTQPYANSPGGITIIVARFDPSCATGLATVLKFGHTSFLKLSQLRAQGSRRFFFSTLWGTA